MPVVTVMPEGKTIEYSPGQSLADIMGGGGVFIDNACGGKGLCGKCRIRITEGDAGRITETESQILKQEELNSGVRLGCLVFPEGDIAVESLVKDKRLDVLESGYLPDFEFKTGLEEGDAKGGKYGIAADIGTTTVVCSLVDMKTGEELGSVSGINAQKHFGLDVLTRITYEMEHPEDGAIKLRNAITGSISGMIRSVCSRFDVSTDEICEITVGANCTMLHMLVGADAVPIGRAPFNPVFVDSLDIKASDIGLTAAPDARLYCLPSVSAYIGADIVAGVYVCGLKDLPGNTVFIDIGTNGEIVLASNGRLTACSCAAGPALEGMNISAGMRAAEGAIEDIHIGEEGLEIKVIGDCEPSGICGSGILTATKELLRTGIVRNTGAFVKAGRFPPGDYRSKYIIADEDGKRSFRMTDGEKPLCITMGDIRQVQLAKGAILSGFTALMNKAGIGMEDLDRVLIAGQFGAHLPAASITGTGILPFEVEDRIDYVGNTSKTGAYMALMSSDVKREMEELAREIGYLELGETENYQELLAECMIFPTF